MATRGPSLSFDPQYVDFVISAWQQQGFATLSAEALQRFATEYAERIFTNLTIMGLAEQHVKQPAIKSAITLLKSLKLIKQASSGSGNARVVKVAVTPLGREILAEEPAVGNIRVGLVGHLVKNSPMLTKLLSSLGGSEPLSRPVANPLPGTPSKGAAFNRAIIEGLAEYDHRGSAAALVSGRITGRQTATQMLKAAVIQATQQHPISGIPSLDKLLSLAAELGLIWRDVKQINQALGTEVIGSAAHMSDGSLIPNVPSWLTSEAHFEDVLSRVYLERVDSSGFVTILALRGGIGRELGISAAVVDAFLCLTREAGDRGECPLTLQFEPNDDLLYTADRRPLIWHETAFDFVEVHRSREASPSISRSSSRNHVGVPPSA